MSGYVVAVQKGIEFGVCVFSAKTDSVSLLHDGVGKFVMSSAQEDVKSL